MKTRGTIFLLLLAGVAGSDPATLWSQEENGPRVTTEVFHVSRVGRANSAETRELLIDFYREIEAEFNAKAKEEFEQRQDSFAGTRVRIIDDLEEKENGRALYLVAYQGRPSVFAFEGELGVGEGDLTEPLEIGEAGSYQTEVTRIKVEREEPSGRPNLETADTGGATFFGIPVGGGSAPASAPKAKGKRIRVTEIQTLPRFLASPSKVTLEEPPVFSKDLFLNAVKNGELYELKRQEKRRCQNCGGFKRVQTTLPVGERAKDGKMACPECGETGEILWDVTYRVTW